MREYADDVAAILKDKPYLLPLWEEAVRTAKPVLTDTYTTAGGVPNKPKLNRVRLEEYAIHNTMVRALWITSGLRWTPSFWHSATIEAAQE